MRAASLLVCVLLIVACAMPIEGEAEEASQALTVGGCQMFSPLWDEPKYSDAVNNLSVKIAASLLPTLVRRDIYQVRPFANGAIGSRTATNGTQDPATYSPVTWARFQTARWPAEGQPCDYRNKAIVQWQPAVCNDASPAGQAQCQREVLANPDTNFPPGFSRLAYVAITMLCREDDHMTTDRPAAGQMISVTDATGKNWRTWLDNGALCPCPGNKC